MDTYDVVVIGGGPAGLAGAVALARSRRRVLVIDAGEPRNAPAEGAHNLLGREGVAPAELLATGRDELASYDGHHRRSTATGARRLAQPGAGTEGDTDSEGRSDGPGEADARFVVALAEGPEVAARALLVTTGLVDVLPDVPGVAERWGHEVLHCPFCHGWEVRDQRIGVLASGPMAAHQAVLFSQLSDQVVVLEHTAPPTEDDRARLGAVGVEVVPGEVVGLEGEPLTGARLADGTVVPLDAVVVGPRMVAASAVLDDLGVATSAHPTGMGTYYPSEPMGATTVPRVRVAGNVTDLSAQVGASAAAGVLAASALHAELIEADIAAVLSRSDAGVPTP